MMSGDQLAIYVYTFFNNLRYIVNHFTGHDSSIFRALVTDALDIGE